MKSTLSVPGRSSGKFWIGTMAVVPIVTLIPEASVARTPVRNKRRIVATWLPLPSSVVTLNGSPMQLVLGVFGLVTLQTLARPPAPFVLVKMSG